MNLNSEARNATMCFSKAGLAEGTNTATILTAAPNGAGTDFCIKGIMYHKTDTDNIAMTALPIQAALTSCLYLVSIDSAGTVTLTKGTAVLTADYNSGSAVLRWPDLPNNQCALGAIKVNCASGYTFTSGTTDLSATGITATYYDFALIPSLPLSV